MTLNLKRFIGVVHLKEWMRDPLTGTSYQIVQGSCSVMHVKELGDFRTSSGESNWFVRIEDESGSRSINILGCQIRAIESGATFYPASPNVWSIAL